MGTANAFELKDVKLAEIDACLARGIGESQAAFVRRLGAQVTTRKKLARYARAMKQGDGFPPAILSHFDGAYLVLDGWHRCSARAARGRETTPAIVFDVQSGREESRVFSWAVAHSNAGISCAESVRRIKRNLLALRRRNTCR